MSSAEPCRDHPDEIAGRYHLGPVLRRSPGCCSHRSVDRLLRRTVSVTLVEGDGLALPEQCWLGRSPEVAEVYDGGSWRGRLFLVTQHPDAPTLAETTPPGGLSAGEVRDLGLAVATALAPWHRFGRSHGGLGAGTVSWSARGAAFADVGLLPWLAQWSDVDLVPPFPAPERVATPAADVYALGRLLGELAPGRSPRALRALLADMTAEDPDARPDVETVLARLDALPPSRRRVGAGAGRAGRRLAVAAVAALLLGSGVGLGALVNGAGAEAASASAAAAEPTPVPGVPLPPLVVPPDTVVGGRDETDDAAVELPEEATAAPADTRSAEVSEPDRVRPAREEPRVATRDRSVVQLDDRWSERERADRERADRSDQERADRERADRDRSDRERADRERSDRDREDRDRSDRDRSDRDRDSRDRDHRDRDDRSERTRRS